MTNVFDHLQHAYQPLGTEASHHLDAEHISHEEMHPDSMAGSYTDFQPPHPPGPSESSDPFPAHHGPLCPRCGSRHTQPLHTGERWAGAVGTVAGAVHGGMRGYRGPGSVFGKTLGALGSVLGSGAGTELGLNAGYRIGALLGLGLGPVGRTVGGVAGAALGALIGGAAGCALGTRLGRAVDRTVLKNQRCLDCGHSFRAPADAVP